MRNSWHREVDTPSCSRCRLATTPDPPEWILGIQRGMEWGRLLHAFKFAQKEAGETPRSGVDASGRRLASALVRRLTRSLARTCAHWRVRKPDVAVRCQAS